ncbi:CTD small phosphatase-like protein 2 isoform X1 [Hordeum vulgare subsp. vulgare]|uniref:CTD small phosphatase-like protein 2 isoform X1 n=1 Tax=Hordeum vulgare subsp. vulgare TaxID=112509 RepID=UPI0002963009|nr:CTD small phosphatase-like protein 2 isoform X1 [Hordeum vulgare subsp. vulgare]
MPTRKKGPARNATVEHVNTKTSRQPRRPTQTAAADKKVNDLITSSSKKQKPAGDPLKKNQVLSGGRKLTSLYDSETENEVADVPSSSMLDHKQSHGDDEEPCENIFSQPFHHHNEDDSDGLSKVPVQSTCGNTKRANDEYSELGSLSPEVSAIYLAMQHSKLECIDEQSQDSISTDECADPDEAEELDEFDPYSFIKDLPELSMVVPKFRPVLLPKQTRSCPRTTLVLDLDETLVHSTLEPCEDSDFTFPVRFNLRDHTIYVRCRPYLKDFLERVASMFEIIIFTASQSIYAEQLLNVLDPKRRLFRHRVYRESCVYVEGNYLKDLSVLGRDLSRVVIVDNSPQAFGFQLDNGIPIESWFDDPNDKELLALLPFLESLVGVEDVRPFIATKFNLRQKVASATSLAMHFFPNGECAS